MNWQWHPEACNAHTAIAQNFLFFPVSRSHEPCSKSTLSTTIQLHTARHYCCPQLTKTHSKLAPWFLEADPHGGRDGGTAEPHSQACRPHRRRLLVNQARSATSCGQPDPARKFHTRPASTCECHLAICCSLQLCTTLLIAAREAVMRNIHKNLNPCTRLFRGKKPWKS